MASDGSVIINTELDDSGFKAGLSKLGSIASGALKGGVAVIGGVTAAAGGAVASLLALEEATEEYRVAQGKLNSAFIAAGSDADMAAYAYSEFYKILGDTDTATEASQLMAQLSTDGEDIAYWTHIAAGAYASFGDALPIEGLIEAANETIKVGEVTGTLADALNWVGISEDAVNEKLAEFSTEAERSEYLMNLLMDAYDGAADTFEEGNASLIAAREAQIQMDNALAELGTAVSDVKTRMTAEFLPAISEVTAGLAGMLSGTEGADEQFSQGIQSIIDTAVERLPEFLTFGTQILTAVLSGLVSNIPVVVSSIPQVVQSIASAFAQMAPQLTTVGAELLTMLVNGVKNGLPVLAQSAVSIMGQLAQGVKENLPSLIETGLTAIAEFSGSLRENAGLVVDGALGLIKSLAEGLIDSLPVMIETVPEIVTNIAGIINDNAPKMILTAAELMLKLGAGLIKAIPTLVENIPQIIEAIVSVIMAFNWIGLGKTIITAFKSGITSMVSAVKSGAGDILKSVNNGLAALPQNLLNLARNGVSGMINGIRSFIGSIGTTAQSMGTAIVNGVKSIPSQLLSIGKNIVQGLIDGIKSGISGVAATMVDLATSVVNSAKKALGIHSPSAVMRDQIGENIGLGVAEGIEQSELEAKAAMAKMSKEISGIIPSVSAGVSIANASMAPAAATAERIYEKTTTTGGVDVSVLSELRAIRGAVLEGKVIMVDKKVLGKVASDANRANTRMTGVVTY